jgi:hypothetical protein
LASNSSAVVGIFKLIQHANINIVLLPYKVPNVKETGVKHSTRLNRSGKGGVNGSRDHRS